MKYANITPFKAQFDKPEVNKMIVSITGDNLTNQASFSYTLLADDISVINGYTYCGGEDYSDWNGNNDFPFNFVADTIGVEIIDIVEEVPETPVEETPEENLEEVIEE
jgi:hypothetical protein